MPTPPLLIALALLATEPSGFDREQVEQVFIQAQQHVEDKAYDEAAEKFEQACALVPESADNRAVRENLALSVLDSYDRAYLVLLDEGGKKQRVFLERARSFRELYLEDFHEAYGEDEPLVPALKQAFDALDTMISEHDKRVYEFEPCLTVIDPDLHPCLSPPPPCLQPLAPRRGCGGEDGDPGLAAALLLPLGLRRRRRDVLERLAETLPADVVSRLRAKLDDDA